MQTFVGMILGMGQVATANRTIVNWDVAETNWNALKVRAHDDWIKLSSK